MMRVEPRRHEDEPRCVLPEDRLDDLVEREEEAGIADSGGEGDVHGEAGPRAPADVGGRARARVVGILVERDVEDARVLAEDRLGPVPVVEIPVDDCDALVAVDGAQMAGGDGGVVEEAEAHGLRRGRVVSGRADEGEAISIGAGRHRVGELDQAPGGEEGGLVGALRGGGVGVDPAAALALRRAHLLDEARAVGGADLVLAGEAGGDLLEARTSPARDEILEHGDPVGAFGMPGAGIVLAEARVDGDRAPKHHIALSPGCPIPFPP
jgi:hypothetical protein